MIAHPQVQVPQPQRANNKSIGHYILGRTIGEGTFGKVKLGRHILSSERVAVKVLEKERIVEVADVERIAREVHILKLIRHPHIVQLYEIIETRGQLYFIMEYASGGELFDYIVANGRVQEPEACKFFHQIIAGVEQIHAMHVVHRDLKPENLLLDEHKRIKIVDFGLSNVFREGQLLKTACGSPCYAPPEMVAGLSYVPAMCDLWSCGVILFALVCGYLPFEDQNTTQLYKKILAADYQLPNFIGDLVKDLIRGLLTTDPGQRMTISMVRAHPWYRQVPEASMAPRKLAPGQLGLDEDVLRELDAYGFPRDYAVRCLQLNKHNHMTTTYYLLLDRRRRVLEQLDQYAADTSAGDAGVAVAGCTTPRGATQDGDVSPAATAPGAPTLSQPGPCALEGSPPAAVGSGKATPGVAVGRDDVPTSAHHRQVAQTVPQSARTTSPPVVADLFAAFNQPQPQVPQAAPQGTPNSREYRQVVTHGTPATPRSTEARAVRDLRSPNLHAPSTTREPRSNVAVTVATVREGACSPEKTTAVVQEQRRVAPSTPLVPSPRELQVPQAVIRSPRPVVREISAGNSAVANAQIVGGQFVATVADPVPTSHSVRGPMPAVPTAAINMISMTATTPQPQAMTPRHVVQRLVTPGASSPVPSSSPVPTTSINMPTPRRDPATSATSSSGVTPAANGVGAAQGSMRSNSTARAQGTHRDVTRPTESSRRKVAEASMSPRTEQRYCVRQPVQLTTPRVAPSTPLSARRAQPALQAVALTPRTATNGAVVQTVRPAPCSSSLGATVGTPRVAWTSTVVPGAYRGTRLGPG